MEIPPGASAGGRPKNQKTPHYGRSIGEKEREVKESVVGWLIYEIKRPIWFSFFPDALRTI